jgi:alpha-L-arabinofuranosidase
MARLALAFHGRGRLQVDWVSLFPPTFKDRPNGLRPDLARHLADLKPAFARYPGGCYVEGLSWESAPDWRTMVCPPEERPGQWGYWQYRSTDGFGYHEFLQFCEDIGAAPLYVAFCGMTVHPENNMPLDRIGPVIQQALDAIEYANGPVTSRWGAVRARMGHPAPFNLRLIEIGNEHPPAIYGDYYVRFREAIKAKHPDVTVIMSMYWSGLNHAAIERAGDANIDMVDEHAYRDAGWIRQNFDYFDRYPRKGWTVYVGEYASHRGGGDWTCALGDSLYLMMGERNGDLVRMASYAPLFVNVNKRDWGVNLIEFDAARSFAHASYYVQKTFAENRPDVNLATECTVFPPPDPETPRLAGRIGLGSWNTEVEFKDLEVTDSNGWTIAAEKFQSLDTWSRPAAGAWTVADGVLRQTDARTAPAKLVLNTVSLTTGTLRVKARRTGGAEGFLVLFNVRDDATFCFANVGGFGNERTVMEYRGESPDGVLRPGLATSGPLENSRWYDVELVVGRDRVELFLDGKKTADATVEDLPALFTQAGYDRRNRRVVLKATHYGRQPVTADIRLDGAADIAGTGRHIVIRSDDPHVDNSLDQPLRIVPEERPLAGCGPRFVVTLPPFSVNVLTVPCEVPSRVAERETR